MTTVGSEENHPDGIPTLRVSTRIAEPGAPRKVTRHAGSNDDETPKGAFEADEALTVMGVLIVRAIVAPL